MGINLYGISASKANAVPVTLESGKVRSRLPKMTAAGSEHTDTVTISSEGSLQRDAARISGSVMNDIRRADRGDASRVEEIKARVADHTYYVSTGAIADAILNRAFGAQS